MAILLNASSADEIVFGANMTSLTLHVSRSIGRCFERGDAIVLSGMDHDGNVAPWLLMARDHGLEVRWLPFDTETFEFDLSELACLLDERTRLVCVGAATSLMFQAMANMAMTMGLLPITGLPLPFISAGGSSMMSSLALVGLVVGVARTGRGVEPFLYPASPVRDRYRSQYRPRLRSQ